MDLRAERTCEFLRNALLAYLDRQPLSSCTVKAVCERAGVSRKAFYAHYEALEDLAQDTYLCRCVYYGRHAKRLADYPSLEAACIEALDQRAQQLLFLRRHPNLARAIAAGVGVSPYFSQIEKADEELSLDHLRTMYDLDGMPEFLTPQTTVHFISSGYFGLVRSWVAQGMAQDIESLTKALLYFSFHCAAGAMGRPIEPVYLQTLQAWHFEETPELVLGPAVS